jgi:hypothetical protein
MGRLRSAARNAAKQPAGAWSLLCCYDPLMRVVLHQQAAGTVSMVNQISCVPTGKHSAAYSTLCHGHRPPHATVSSPCNVSGTRRPLRLSAPAPAWYAPRATSRKWPAARQSAACLPATLDPTLQHWSGLAEQSCTTLVSLRSARVVKYCAATDLPSSTVTKSCSRRPCAFVFVLRFTAVLAITVVLIERASIGRTSTRALDQTMLREAAQHLTRCCR